MSCEKCTNIVFRPWDKLNADEVRCVTQFSVSAHAGDGRQRNLLFAYFHHKTMGDLERSNEHCHLCRKLLVAFRQVTAARTVVKGRKKIVDLYPRPPILLLTTMIGRSDQVYDMDNLGGVTAHCGPFAISSELILKQDPTLLTHPGAVNRFAISDLRAAAYDTSTTSSDSLGLAKYWYQHCTENHELCSGLTQRSTLPHWILDIADPLRPVLTLGRGRTAKYATLSYKWGTGERFLTTTQNHASFQEGFDSYQLPNTFADAILMAHNLGFGFFWIDALCIRHDMAEELSEQISMMETIYAASSLTIFAAWGDSAHDGLAVTRDPWLVKPSEVVLKLDWEGHQLENTIYFGRWHTFPYTKERGDVEEPLFERGWVLQEQVLSLRGLIFNHDQMSWQCLALRCRTKESQPSTRIPPALKDYIAPRFEPTYYGTIVRSLHLYTVDQVLAAWYALIENYSGRNFTYTSDTLRALSGLINALSRLYDLSCIAGLWEQDLGRGLLWWQGASTISSCKYEGFRWATWTNRFHSNRRTEPHWTHSNQLSTSEDPFQHASWSWVSRSGKGRVLYLGKADDTTRDQWRPYSLETVHAPANSRPFAGELEMHVLTIRARVQQAKIEMYRISEDYDPAPSPDGKLRFGLLDPGDPKPKMGQKFSSRLIGELHPDHWSSPLYDGDVVLCIFCVQEYIEGERRDYCLAVMPTGEPNRYRRIGLAMLANPSSPYITERALSKQIAAERLMVLDLV